MEPDPVRQANYMWRTQEDFRLHAVMGFEEILAELRWKLAFTLVLVGFETGGRRAVRVEPDAPAFPLEELEEEYEAFGPEYAPPPDDDAPSDDAYNASIRAHDGYCVGKWSLLSDALKTEIDPVNTLSFCSQPCQVGNHLVSLVLLVSRADYDNHPQLNEVVAYVKRGHHPSFLHAVIEVYLQRYSSQITAPPQVGSFLVRDRDPRELLRAAGARFTYYAAYAGRTFDPEEMLRKGPYELFEACNVISFMRYEGAEGLGRMIVSERTHSAIRVEVEFREPVGVDDYRKVRKLLEMCNEKTWLLSADRKIYGLGFVDYPVYRPSEERLFEIRGRRQVTSEFLQSGSFGHC